MNDTRRATVCFLQKDNETLLALIEYTPTDRKWNGLGGWVEKGESLEDGVVREIKEETFIHVDKTSIRKVVEVVGERPLHVFFADKWNGEVKIKESSIKDLQWFTNNQLPFSLMWPGTEQWLLPALQGKLVKVVDGQIEEVNEF